MLALGLAAPAFADSECHDMMVQVEQAMKTSTLDTATIAKIAALLEVGKAAHDIDDHATAMKAFNEALILLKV